MRFAEGEAVEIHFLNGWTPGRIIGYPARQDDQGNSWVTVKIQSSGTLFHVRESQLKPEGTSPS